MAQTLVDSVIDSKPQLEAVMHAAGSRPQISFLRRIWNAMFRSSNEDFEKKLQHLSKEEAEVHARLKRRSHAWQRFARAIVLYSVIIEFVAVGFAIISTRSTDLTLQMRALRVLPVFALPGLSALFYSFFASFHRMCERKDQRTLDKLRAERQAKLDELKQRTNYYLTQQLIQKYDLDPAAKAAAASVLALKLGAESGLKVSLQDDPKNFQDQGQSQDVELVDSSGLRNRKHPRGKSREAGSIIAEQVPPEPGSSADSENLQCGTRQQEFDVEHHQRGKASEAGWVARLAAMLVGEDPTQCYALICGNCHLHNGLARKEDFPHIIYYCPHCHALNGSRQTEDGVSAGANSASVTAPNGSTARQRHPHSDTGTVTPDDITNKLADASVVSQPQGD